MCCQLGIADMLADFRVSGVSGVQIEAGQECRDPPSNSLWHAKSGHINHVPSQTGADNEGV